MAQQMVRDTPAAQQCAVSGAHAAAVARAQARLADSATYRGVADLFAALADPTRARLVHALVSDELCTCDLALLLGITESAVSQHLRVLRRLHVVRPRRSGKFVYYRLDDAHVAQLMRIGLAHQGHSEGVLLAEPA